MTAFELWRLHERLGETELVGPRYGWMVWEVGPAAGGEDWFESEEEARGYIAAKLDPTRDDR